jgi:hypothetical protein
VTGKKKLHIPWKAMAKEPSKWVKKKSYPKDFKWDDPSHIRIEDAFELIAHWRKRVSRGKRPLAWVKTSPFFKGVQSELRRSQVIQQRGPVVRESSQEYIEIPSFANVREEDESADEEEEKQCTDEGSDLGTDADVDTGEDEDLRDNITGDAMDEDIIQPPGEHCTCRMS